MEGIGKEGRLPPRKKQGFDKPFQLAEGKVQAKEGQRDTRLGEKSQAQVAIQAA